MDVLFFKYMKIIAIASLLGAVGITGLIWVMFLFAEIIALAGQVQ